MKGYYGVNCEFEIDECKSYPCGLNGVCLDEVDGFNCVCYPGWSGIGCEMKLDFCVSNPCLNSGDCLNGECICKFGFTGQRCESQINPCNSDPPVCSINSICHFTAPGENDHGGIPND